MTKKYIDKYFGENWEDIQRVVQSNSSKCITVNITDISSEIYLICIEKKDKIHNLPGFIRILASNIYRWEKSSFNKSNKILSNEIIINELTIRTEDPEKDNYQNRLYCLEKFKMNAKPHELRFFDIFVNKNIRTIRSVAKEVGVSTRGAAVMIQDFKSKIQSYERKD